MLHSLIRQKIQPNLVNVGTSLIRKIGVLLEFSRMPRYVPELNCVLDIDNNAGIKVYSLRTQDQDLFLQYLKILEEGLGPVVPFEVQTNSSQLLEKKLNYKKIEKDYDCKVRSWLHEENQEYSSLYAYAKRCPPEKYLQVQEGIKRNIKENEASRVVVVLLCPETVIEKAREKELDNELLAEIAQLNKRSFKKPQWIVRKLDESQTSEQSSTFHSKCLIWKYLRDSEFQKFRHEDIQNQFQNGVRTLTNKVKIKNKYYDFRVTFNAQGDSIFESGNKRFALRRVIEVSELCFFKKQFQNLAETVVSFIKLIPINWDLVKQTEGLQNILEGLEFTDVTYLQQQEGIVLNWQLKQLFYLSSTEISPNAAQEVLIKLKKLIKQKQTVPVQYQALYQIKNYLEKGIKCEIKLPVQQSSKQYQFVKQKVPQKYRNSFKLKRIQNFTKCLPFLDYVNQLKTVQLKAIEVCIPKAKCQFPFCYFLPTQFKLEESLSEILSSAPYEQVNKENFQESKSPRVEADYLMYQLLYTSMKEQILDYDGLDINPSFVNSQIETHDLVRVKNSEGRVYYCPKLKEQILLIYEITW